MRSFGVIFLKELHQLFSGWSAYVIASAVLLLDGLFFFAFALGSREKYSYDVLTDFFYFSSGIAMVASIVLGMRLIAEEKQKKTLILYFTAPISERVVIYSKFFSVLIYFIFLHVLSLYLPGLIFIHGKLSITHIAIGYLGLTLLGSACLAISIFASSLSGSQMISVIIASFITVVLLLLWMLADVVGEPYKSVFGYLAIHNDHFIPFMRGILNSRDVIYYLSLSIFFLEASTLVIKKQRFES